MISKANNCWTALLCVNLCIEKNEWYFQFFNSKSRCILSMVLYIYFPPFCKLIFPFNAISNDNNILNIWIMTSANFPYKLSLKFHLKTQLLPIKIEIVERDVLFIFVVLIYYLSLAYMCEVGKIILHRLLKSNITPS